MQRYLMIIGLVLVAMMSFTTVAVASPSSDSASSSATVSVDDSSSDGVTSSYGDYWQNNGFCYEEFQQGAARMTVNGGRRNKLVIVQQFMYYSEYWGEWIEYARETRRKGPFNGYGKLTLKVQWYYDDFTEDVSTQLRSTFKWYRNGVLKFKRVMKSGVCNP